MHHAPPIGIDGFDHPHAFTGIPDARRPEWGSTRCGTCSGRGVRNEILHLDTGRCRIVGCADCDGSGWRSADGSRHRHDVAFVDGSPAWTTVTSPPCRIIPLDARGRIAPAAFALAA